jgi:molybdopterin-guanine dinucleotide biosynthesis protein A
MLTLSIQAGGRSSRMGQDKALVDFGGQPLIQHVLTRLESLPDEVIVTTNDPDSYQFLDLPLFLDRIPDRGALGGLYTALYAASHPLVAVVACDMPFASIDLLAYCRDQLMLNTELGAVIPSTVTGLEPLHAIYRRKICLPAVEAALDSNHWKMTSWHEDAHVSVLSPECSRPYDPDGIVFWNVNTPEDLREALAIHQKS